ncbi:hypothetical protein ACG873_11730 [Mesorhizobium sp. AaZ16]|uniref:hypothetical protein n=1 Tax=Mesorhizobium sp. AaZ16 TaxID=3402289 RepID=UPI00374F731D
MADRNMTTADSKMVWFAAGALAMAALVALFLYADGYFDRSDSIELKIQVPENGIIEGQ